MYKELKYPELKLLSRVFKKYPDIQAVYLFGSVVSGKVYPESDLDLAIVSKAKSLREKKLEILTDLGRYGFCNVGLVFLA